MTDGPTYRIGIARIVQGRKAGMPVLQYVPVNFAPQENEHNE